MVILLDSSSLLGALSKGTPFPYSLYYAAEFLLRGLDKKSKDNIIKPFTHPTGSSIISHLSYYDDIIIFTNGNKRSCQKLMDFLHSYEDLSGQKINMQKSSFTMDTKTHINRRNAISSYLGMQFKLLRLKYLVRPLYNGRLKFYYFTN